MAEAFLHHRDAHPPDAAPDGARVVVHLRVVLARIEPVHSRDRLEHDRVVPHVPRHRPGVVDGRLDRHHSGVGDESVGRLHPVAAAERRGDADRAALIASDRHVHETASDERSGAGGRAAGGVARLVRVLHRPRGTGVAASRQAEVLAVRLADDGRPSIEQARDDGRVHVGGVALQSGGAVHHRHPGEAYVVLQRDRASVQRSAGRAAHLGSDVPGVQRVLVGRDAVAGGAWVEYRRQVVGHRVDDVVCVEGALHHVEELLDPGIRHVHAQLGDNFLELGVGRPLRGHITDPPVEFGAAPGLRRGGARVRGCGGSAWRRRRGGFGSR